MDYIDACRIAYEYYQAAWHVRGLCEAKDLGEKWIFYPASDEVFFGNSHITVSKRDGRIEPFVLPDVENFRLMKNGVVTEIPEEFRS